MTETTERTEQSEQEVKAYHKWYEPKTTSESQDLKNCTKEEKMPKISNSQKWAKRYSNCKSSLYKALVNQTVRQEEPKGKPPKFSVLEVRRINA